ncbi:Uncharacterised protein [Chlamydia trachomatis]|nr:Uncharacterised protein [Chlamydia trachomatis]
MDSLGFHAHLERKYHPGFQKLALVVAEISNDLYNLVMPTVLKTNRVY